MTTTTPPSSPRQPAASTVELVGDAHRSSSPMALTANHMPPGAEDAHGLLRELVEGIVERPTAAAQRLGSAKTSIRFRVGDDDAASFVLLADRHPPAVVDVDEPAEVELRLSLDQAAALAAGDLVIPIEIMGSNLEYDGPVRKYLDIDPILRALLVPEESP